MDAERSDSAPVTRHTFLLGVAGGAGAGAPRGLRASGRLAASRPSVTVDLARTTGKTVSPYLYGYATGALMDDDFRLAANATVEKSAKTLAPALLRFNTPVSTIMQTVFAQGVSHPDWTPVSRWTKDHADFLGVGGRLIFGIGPAGGDTSIPPATWAKYAGATAAHFRSIGQEITYWEVGNECDPMGAVTY